MTLFNNSKKKANYTKRSAFTSYNSQGIKERPAASEIKPYSAATNQKTNECTCELTYQDARTRFYSRALIVSYNQSEVEHKFFAREWNI